jgi:hypothetical protein
MQVNTTQAKSSKSFTYPFLSERGDLVLPVFAFACVFLLKQNQAKPFSTEQPLPSLAGPYRRFSLRPFCIDLYRLDPRLNKFVYYFDICGFSSVVER